MRQPTPVVTPFARAEELLAALGVAESRLPVELYDNGARHVIVTLASEAAVSALAPVTAVIAGFGVTGVNCIAGAGASWRNRMFWAHGEDAASGSAAGPIACHLARHGLVAWGDEVTVLQGVELGRPSTLVAKADGADGRIDAVEVGGSAVVVARGEFRV
jgi:trans-2,3-dihydro-3-hydroxyanthranilate isomerase